jgi:glycosyltransferase involved in cell wall biosynthesis
MADRRYCLISPCRDEARFLARTLASVADQTVPPTYWIIVDDGSTDETPAILTEFAARRPWVQLVRRGDRGQRKVGPGVVDAFYEGYRRARHLEWDYVCKLDMDLDLPPGYFEALIARMEAEPRLGSTSGQAYYPDAESGRLVSEGLSPEMSVGMTKFYRRRCFEQIGGFVREVMWDGIDCHRARMLGWKVNGLDEPGTRFVHLRPMGSSHRGIWTGRRRHGFGQYFMGTGFLYMTVSAIYRMARPPRLVGGVAMWWGYVISALRREGRLDDPEFRSFLRRCQRRMLLRGKRRATAAVEAERARDWDPNRRTGWELAAGPDLVGDTVSSPSGRAAD